MHRDNQSSILAITNEAGTVVEKRLFDAWGNVVAVQDGAGVALPKMMFFERGYTGHEHLQGVGLINMNARLYDPKLHRFLQADDFVQDPSNTQNYNRYAYCVNNPLKYTDPSGNIFGIDDILISAIIVAALIGAGVGIAVSIGTSLYYGTPITAGGIIGAAIMGAVSGAITCGIGNLAASSFTNFYSQATFQALAHGAFQGTLSSIQGGSFLQGFAAGALSSIASSVFGGASGKESGFFKENNWAWGTKEVFHSGIGTATGTVGMIAFGSIMGGVGSSLTGGNFWQGAVTGAFVSGLNHAMPHGDGPKPKPKKTNYAQWQKEGQKLFKKIEDLYNKYIYAEVSAVAKVGTYIDVGLKHVGRLTAGNYNEKGIFWSNRDGLNSNYEGEKYVAGIALTAGAQYTCDVPAKQNSLSAGYGIFAVDLSPQSTFIGVNFNLSGGVGIGGETGFKLGIKFIIYYDSIE